MLHAARWKCRMQKSPKVAICAPSYTFVGLYLRNEGTYRQWKKNVKQQYLVQMSPHGKLRPTGAEIDPVVWGTPANSNGFRVLAALLYSSQLVSVSQTLQR